MSSTDVTPSAFRCPITVSLPSALRRPRSPASIAGCRIEKPRTLSSYTSMSLQGTAVRVAGRSAGPVTTDLGTKAALSSLLGTRSAVSAERR